MATNTILLDVGGTFIKGADGRQTPIASGGSRADIASALTEAIGPLEGVPGIGVAIPGPFDYRRGIFLMKHKFAAVYGESFRSLTGVPETVPLKFMHDVNAPLAGAIEMLHLEQGNTALITLGTGLGFSYAICGDIQCDPNGSPARSLWNMPAVDGGILEDRISARGIKAAWVDGGGDNALSVADIAGMAYAGDERAIAVFYNLGGWLGDALQGLFDELKIDTLLMGGQISKSLSLLIDPLQERLERTRILPLPEGAVFEGLATMF